MANRSYLYSLSNRPTSYADRPDTISGLSEWAYFVPFSYRLLMSGDPQICSSLVSDGFDSDPPNKKTKLHAISSDFDIGFSRLKKFFAVLRPVASGTSTELIALLDETVGFLEAHHDHYLLLETIELDCMTEEGKDALRTCVEKEITNCRRVGAAVDALPGNVIAAGSRLKEAVQKKLDAPLDAFYGLCLDNDFDNVRDEKTEYPMGLEWSEVLYFELWNRAQFEANR